MKRLPPVTPFFDIGGGNGVVAAGLESVGLETVLVEPGPGGIANARKRGLERLISSSFQDAQFVPESLPSAGLFDVLEHIEDDHGFLCQLHIALTGGGRLFITVPAFQVLWSAHDEQVGHYRRYTLNRLRKLLHDTGFVTEYVTCFFSVLPLPGSKAARHPK